MATIIVVYVRFRHRRLQHLPPSSLTHEYREHEPNPSPVPPPLPPPPPPQPQPPKRRSRNTSKVSDSIRSMFDYAERSSLRFTLPQPSMVIKHTLNSTAFSTSSHLSQEARTASLFMSSSAGTSSGSARVRSISPNFQPPQTSTPRKRKWNKDQNYSECNSSKSSSSDLSSTTLTGTRH